MLAQYSLPDPRAGEETLGHIADNQARACLATNLATKGKKKIGHLERDGFFISSGKLSLPLQVPDCCLDAEHFWVPAVEGTARRRGGQELVCSVHGGHLENPLFHSGNQGFIQKSSRLGTKGLRATSQLIQPRDVWALCVSLYAQHLLLQHLREAWRLCYLSERKNRLSQHSNYGPLKCKFGFMH